MQETTRRKHQYDEEIKIYEVRYTAVGMDALLNLVSEIERTTNQRPADARTIEKYDGE